MTFYGHNFFIFSNKIKCVKNTTFSPLKPPNYGLNLLYSIDGKAEGLG